MIAFFVLFVLLALFLGATVKATIVLQSTVIETLTATEAPFGQTGSLNLTHSGLNKSTVREATSAAGENVTQTVYGKVTMAAGVGSLNLASAPGLNGVLKDLTGLRIRSIHLRAAAANANPITIAKGAANGFTGLGAAFSLTLSAGREALLEPDQTAVAAAVRVFDVTGTGTQELEFIITAGDN